MSAATEQYNRSLELLNGAKELGETAMSTKCLVEARIAMWGADHFTARAAVHAQLAQVATQSPSIAAANAEQAAE